MYSCIYIYSDNVIANYTVDVRKPSGQILCCPVCCALERFTTKQRHNSAHSSLRASLGASLGTRSSASEGLVPRLCILLFIELDVTACKKQAFSQLTRQYEGC